MATIATLKVNLVAQSAAFERGMKRSSKSLTRFGGTAQQVKGQLLGMLAAVGGAMLLRRAITELAEFEKQIANVSTMLDKSSMKYMPQYEKAINRMAIAFGESTATLSKGLYDILSATIEPAKALDVLTISVKAAKGGFTDTAIAADAITTILNSYSMSAERAEEVSDFLFMVVKRGKTTFAELAPSIGKVAAVASIAGIGLDELGAAISTLTRAGLKTDVATTSLRTLLSLFLKSTPQARKAAKEFGLELSTTTLQTIGLAGVLEKLKDASAGQVATVAAEKRALVGLAAALKQSEGFYKDVALQQNKAGAAAEAYAKMTKNLSFELARATEALKFIGRMIISDFRPTIESIVKLLQVKAIRQTMIWTAKLLLLAGVFKIVTVAVKILIAAYQGLAVAKVIVLSLSMNWAALAAAAGIAALGTAAVLKAFKELKDEQQKYEDTVGNTAKGNAHLGDTFEDLSNKIKEANDGFKTAYDALEKRAEKAQMSERMFALLGFEGRERERLANIYDQVKAVEALKEILEENKDIQKDIDLVGKTDVESRIYELRNLKAELEALPTLQRTDAWALYFEPLEKAINNQIRLLEGYDKRLKTFEGFDALKSKIESIKDSLKTPVARLADFVKTLVEGIKEGLLTLVDARLALEQKAQGLFGVTPYTGSLGGPRVINPRYEFATGMPTQNVSVLQDLRNISREGVRLQKIAMDYLSDIAENYR